MDNYKTCSRCKESLSITLFSYRQAAKDGLTSWCRPCMAENANLRRLNNPKQAKNIAKKSYEKNKHQRNKQSAEWRKKNKAHRDAYQKEWRASNREKLAYYSLKHNPKRRAHTKSNKTYVITDKEINKLRNSPCFYCGSNKKIELDHVIPICRNGTHGLGNIVSSCQHCNRQKKDKTVMEWRIWKKRLGL